MNLATELLTDRDPDAADLAAVQRVLDVDSGADVRSANAPTVGRLENPLPAARLAVPGEGSCDIARTAVAGSAAGV